MLNKLNRLFEEAGLGETICADQLPWVLMKAQVYVDETLPPRDQVNFAPRITKPVLGRVN
ncbi:MAG: hypothetical protein JOZ32_08220 [Bryobacterales bacterium]|nr:hypothetical protein [Bryobacterales bacterium]